METAKKVFIASLFTVAALGTGCSKGNLKALSDTSACPNPSCTEEQNKESLEPTPSIPKEVVYKDIDLDGQIKGGTYNKMSTLALDKQNNALILYVPVGVNVFINNFSGAIPELPGASFKSTKLANGTSVIAVSIPLKYILKGVSFLENARLPNGDPLPEVPAGELPSLGIKLGDKKDVNFYLYLGVGVVAVYITSPFNPWLELTFPVTNRDQTKVVGYFAMVPEKEKAGVTYQGGFFLSTVMPDEISRALDNYF